MDQTRIQHQIQQLINEIIAAGDEVGLQVAAYLNGELIVDAWAGIADETTGQPVTADTLFTSWSTTKGIVATCAHILADQGQLDYDKPIAYYWPEFAANGKAGVTVRHALTHRAGIPYMPANVTPEMMTDWEAMCAAIATHEPLWPPGTQTAYHAWTYGWLVGEVVRRIDGRPFGQFVREVLCAPLNIEGLYLGISDEVEPRVARLRHAPPEPSPADAAAAPAELIQLVERVMPPNVTHADVMNRPDIRRACIPGGGGTMNARAVARHYAMLANGGALDDVRVLSSAQIDIARAMQTDDVDLIANSRVRRGLGYGLGGPVEEGGSILQGPGGGEFGHGGLGGSLGFADPERGLSFGLTKNLLEAKPDVTQVTAYKVTQKLRELLQ